ncbi:MAG: nucleotidyl transferase AbiEii/AbiGii toxin family protein [Actinomycetota bacterium]
MKKNIKNKPASIRAKLANISRIEGIDFDALLLRYFQERFLYRIAISEFSKHFILKGGLLLIYFQIPGIRPTKDIDFLVRQLNNSQTELEDIFRKIANLHFDDGVNFKPLTVCSERIKEDTDYEGIRIKIEATLSQARKRLQMDIGFGDVVIPKAKKIRFPTLLEQLPPKIKAYSVESIISEKFEAMVKLAMANSRMKDFYDVFTLSAGCNFQSHRLKIAIKSTFNRRKTPIPENPLIFRVEFHDDGERHKQWAAFLRKSRLNNTESNFSQIMKRITDFLKPIIISIINKTEIEKTWDPLLRCWKK